ncbi:hypothetical protein KPL37_13490 [Clostridium frigoris]|uniref:Uncharacterized protein n=1 Tax=Clostridium frigoris TaxID=205327 RepID=A0ABS6BV10_9CLOT|nr:hypothetical protein [Clostridium frigoris]MBU3160756.1 hypothetical protein [Clostridium frigoris]
MINYFELSNECAIEISKIYNIPEFSLYRGNIVTISEMYNIPIEDLIKIIEQSNVDDY